MGDGRYWVQEINDHNIEERCERERGGPPTHLRLDSISLFPDNNVEHRHIRFCVIDSSSMFNVSPTTPVPVLVDEDDTPAAGTALPSCSADKL